MRIGIDARAIYKSLDGIGRYSLNLIRGLARIDKENEYVLFRNYIFNGTIVESPNFREVRTGIPALSLRTGICFGSLIKKEAVDVFHSPFFVAPFWGIDKLVVTVHDLMALNFPGFFSGRNFLLSKYAYLFHKYMVPLTITRSRKIIAVSQNTKSDLERCFNLGSDRVSVVYEAADQNFRKIDDTDTLETYRKNARLPENFILYVGNTKPYKNVYNLLKAFKALCSTTGYEYVLVMAGKKDRFHQAVYQTARDLELTPNIIFFDNFTEKELPLLYNLAKLFVFPSYYEGFGLPPLEALSCGTPVITSNRSSLPEVVGESAILVDPDDVGGLAGAMQRVLSDSALREDMSRKGVEQSKLFSWERAARETLNIYKSIAHSL